MKKVNFVWEFNYWIISILLLITFSCKSTIVGNSTPKISSPNQENENDENVYIEIPYFPLESEADLDVLLAEIGDKRIVLLGEASHGTSEYYRWRTAITKRLIQEKGFDFIAVEGEWADSYRVNQFIKGPKKDTAEVVALLKNYNRWPTWMWGNFEVAELVSWLNRYNQGKSEDEKVSFYGLDVYCLWESMQELIPYLPKTEKKAIRAARRVNNCFRPFTDDGQEYALAVAGASANCRTATYNLWKQIQEITPDGESKTEAHFVMEQNALVAKNAERYYSTMVSNSSDSWNIRDNHMMETLKRLVNFHGQNSKAIIWEHNTHVGDARYTDMAAGGMINVGQLARQEWGQDQVYIVGFGSYEGSVIAAREWGSEREVMQMPEAAEGSWENILHQLNTENKIIISRQIEDMELLKRPIGHRAIGVVYQPHLESFGNYVPSIIPKRYDVFLYFDKTTALHPLDMPVKNEPPDLYPWGY